MRGFPDYLVQKRLITEAEREHALAMMGELNLRTGLCAYAFGFLDEKQIQGILNVQRKTGAKFGEIAIGMGHLQQGQLATILRMQDKYRVEFEDILEMEGILPREVIDSEFRVFQGKTAKKGKV